MVRPEKILIFFFVMGQCLPLVLEQLRASSAQRGVWLPFSAAQPALKTREVPTLLGYVKAGLPSALARLRTHRWVTLSWPLS